MAEDRLVSETSDPLGNVSVQEADGRGNIVRVARKDSAGRQLTEVTYEYNEMGEMLKAFDAKGHPISVEYDLLGRRTALESLDSGRQEFFYDECSNLVRENNSVLRENNKQILYEYDGLNRLARIDYPDTEDTSYTYGKPSDSKVGAAGKILSIEDASGKLSYEYGKLGEVTKETRTLLTHLNGSCTTETAVMEYRADYLGRMQWIVYPDKEKVTYGYDCGGQVVTVKGEHYGRDFPYVNDILYDQYGQRTKIVYGNGTETEYSYDSARRWLDTIRTKNKWEKSLQNISYSFDAVGNVLGYENNCLDMVTGNYRTSQTYSYDSLYQLVRADGETVYDPHHSGIAPEFKSRYSQIFEFDADGLGNMTGKASQETVTPQKSIGDNLNYSFGYVYDEKYAHRLVSAGERYYKYDSNGNIVMEQDGSFEANGTEGAYHRINRETDDVYSTDYGWGLYKDSDGKKTTTRAYSRTYDWNERNQLVGSADANYTTTYVYGQDGQRSNKYTKNSETLYFNKMWTHRTDSALKVYGGQTAKNIYLGETRIVTKLNAGSNPTVQEESDKQYFYHSDHLGSASLISDCDGNEYQRIEYTPYGEIWVEKTENNGLAYLPYKFTGKEMDKETGLYYYGARYLDAKYSRWISADPALGEYMSGADIGCGGIYNHVNFNLYHYAGNNPIRYIDPDGRNTLDDYAYQLRTRGETEAATRIERQAAEASTSSSFLLKQEFAKFMNSFDKTKSFLDNTSNFVVLSGECLKKTGDVSCKIKGYTKGTQSQLPLPAYNDPSKVEAGKSLCKTGSKLGNVIIVASIAYDITDGIKVGYETDDFWHGFYRGATNVATTCFTIGGGIAGGALGSFVTPGVGTTVGGIAGGMATEVFFGWVFGKIEENVFKQEDYIELY